MLTTSAFFQLAPSVVQRIRNKYRVMPRTSLPTRLTFLVNCGVDSDELDALRAILTDAEEERMAAALVLQRLFRGQTFHASEALTTWVRRKGRTRPEVKEAAIRLAETLLEAEEVIQQAVNPLGKPTMDACATKRSARKTKKLPDPRQPSFFEADNFASFQICS
ncbi:MAG: hypothetical protein Q4E62_09140 [Sutterellaceae bacterium]|nr:hypothetical protein [Sutterellaceae bacterium]